MKLKDAMKKAKKTGKPQFVTEKQIIGSIRINISTWLDQDVLNGLKHEAAELGVPYEKIVNEVLKRYLVAKVHK